MPQPTWQPIAAFELDDVDQPALPFAARLARENGWTRRYAERVIQEYKRFAFLAVTAGPVCPSEDVDQAWHLHLTYTRSYWKRFCGEVLGAPLHHEPTKGGPAESDKHRRMYERTLQVYQQAFGEQPPNDIWPAIAERFAPASRFVRVDRDRNWVIPKRFIQRIATGVGVAFLVLVGILGCAGGMNPFNLEGEQFLYFLMPTLIAAVIAGRILHTQLRAPGPQPGDDTLELDWQQTAYLNGQEHRLATAALARLFASKAIQISETDNQLIATGPEPEGLTRVEQAVFRELPVEKSPVALRKMGTAAFQAYSDEIEQLQREGFTIPTRQGCSNICLALLPLLFVLFAVGVPRMILGFWNGKPTDFLVALLLFGGIIGLIVVVRGSQFTTRRADRILKRMQNQYAHLQSHASDSPNPALAVALFGTAALMGTAFAMLGTWFPHQTTSTGGCGSGCGMGGCSGDGDGGSGCGGCGGD
ncbi:MAG: TIGR04222 domain-containing membrane protein [Bacteroidales bacterium]|nr:TIGR04222 domain-containing membrane protein [Bacteroidales bacterium]